MNDVQLSYRQSAVYMDTVVTIELPGGDDADAVERAFGWFAAVEAACSRFDNDSELMQLCARPDEAVEVSPLLFEAVRFALAMAEVSDGAFDPTVGGALVAAGFDRNYRTGQRVPAPAAAAERASYRDVLLDEGARTVRLLRPLVLDLGAVAKGFAIDLAAQELSGYEHYSINAGGDIFVRGLNAEHSPWRVGIRHPRDPDSLIAALAVSEGAVCTSGDYERKGTSEGHHILYPASGAAVSEVASVTVLAPSAMLADALATAAFVLGPERGIALLEAHDAEGLIVLTTLECTSTEGFGRYLL